MKNTFDYCEYCDFEDWKGKDFNFIGKTIDGKNQNFEVYLLDDPELEERVIFVNGTHTELSVKIHYCPICGREL